MIRYVFRHGAGGQDRTSGEVSLSRAAPFSIFDGEPFLEPSHKIFEHWQDLSGNAAKLLVWLVVNAPRSGMMAMKLEDVARANGWTPKVLRGAVKELESKACITVERVTGRHALTRIRITPSILGSSDPATPSQMGSSADATPSQSNAQEKVTPSQNGRSGSSTPSQMGSNSVPDVPDEPSLGTKPLGFPGMIPAGCLFTNVLSPIACQALAYIGFECDRRHLSIGFVSVLDWLGKRQHLPLPGILATMILDRCLFQQRKRKADGKNPSLYLFPPGLQRHRDILRKKERAAGKAERQARAA